MCAIQGIEFRRPLKTSKNLELIIVKFRTKISALKEDRYMAIDINIASEMIRDGALIENLNLPTYSQEN